MVVCDVAYAESPPQILMSKVLEGLGFTQMPKVSPLPSGAPS